MFLSERRGTISFTTRAMDKKALGIAMEVPKFH
jgi:hypothetical protein